MCRSDRDLFSVYIFIYRNEEGLKKTIKSVYEQNYERIELIISDDHSIEDCSKQYQIIEEALEPYKVKFEKIIINVNKKNLGTVKHINTVLNWGNGKYICLLGCGDGFYREDVLQKVYYHFEICKTLVCTSKRIMCLDDRNIILPSKRVVKYMSKSSRDLLNLCCREINYIATIGTFFRREIFRKYGCFDEAYCLMEDAPFFLKILFNDEKISFIDEVTCFYAKGGVSNRREIDERLFKDSVRTLVELKYPNRNKLGGFTRRVVSFKYFFRGSNNWRIKLQGCFFFPDALIFMGVFTIIDRLSKNRYLN